MGFSENPDKCMIFGHCVWGVKKAGARYATWGGDGGIQKDRRQPTISLREPGEQSQAFGRMPRVVSGNRYFTPHIETRPFIVSCSRTVFTEDSF